jgi:hypothetical protein
MRVKGFLAGAALALSAFQPVHAEAFISDPGADAATAVYTQACIRNMGHVERVTQWAEAHSLKPVTAGELNQSSRNVKWVFVSGGSKIALLVSPTNQSCTVLADRAGQDGILKGFGALAQSMVAMNGAANVKVKKARTDGQFGSMLTAEFTVARNHFFDHIIGRMVAVERPGGPFQVLLQVEAVDAGAMPK